MRSVAEHQRVVTDLIRSRPPVPVALHDAQGLVLAEDVVTAERYIAALTPAAEPVSADVVTFPVAKEEKLARAA